MSRDADTKTARLYDKRTVERNIKKGLMGRKDYEKHIKSLEDVAGKGVYGERSSEGGPGGEGNEGEGDKDTRA